MRKKNKNQSQSSEQNKGILKSRLSRLTGKVTGHVSATWYQDITLLPLDRFITASVDNDLSALIIAGEPELLQLIAAWNDIQQQYADCIGDSETKMVIKLQAAHAELHLKMTMFNFLFEQMGRYYCEQYGREMNTLLKTSFVFDPVKDRIGYYKTLERCFNRAKSFKIEYNLNEAKLDAVIKKTNGKAPTREYYRGIHIELSNFAKYNIPDTITVWEFGERMRQYNMYRDKLEQQVKDQTKKSR